jgi:hypothetical protein
MLALFPLGHGGACLSQVQNRQDEGMTGASEATAALPKETDQYFKPSHVELRALHLSK